jgi:glycosyltransferase involved in cell wall biosynthesis
MPKSPVFVTRKFPPSVGGMETLAAGVWRSLRRARSDSVLIAHRGPNWQLPVWFPFAFARLAWLIVRRRVEVVIAGDALTYAVVRPLLTLAGLPSATMIHGLDVTFPMKLYRVPVHWALRRAPLVVANSRATADHALDVGVGAGRVKVLRLGVEVPEVADTDRIAARKALNCRLNLADGARVVVTMGRLVRRKGVRWFVTAVLPNLPPSVHYVIAGAGPESTAIAAEVEEKQMTDRVHLLGRVDEHAREELLRGADVFVQPNIVVADDVEGFGLVTVEAALRGTPVVAANLQGLRDAVVDGQTGILLPPEEPSVWSERLLELLDDREILFSLGSHFKKEAAARYGEEAMAEALCDAVGIAAQSE